MCGEKTSNKLGLLLGLSFLQNFTVTPSNIEVLMGLHFLLKMLASYLISDVRVAHSQD